MNTPDGYEEAARKAAERWKSRPTPELRDQIIATWRMAKEHMRASESGVRIGQLQEIWEGAFHEVADWDFDFRQDDQNTF
jgi:hypothetical protein